MNLHNVYILLIQGYMGKSHYEQGGGVNYLCLPTDPEFSINAESGYQTGAYIYGVEYEPFVSSKFFADEDDQDVPCAVCEVNGRSKLMMIPAKYSCPDSWTEEYDGFLVSESHSGRSSEFVCVSSGMESVASGVDNVNGGAVFVVEAVCGPLPCPHYVDGYELSCVVCTK